MLQKIFIWLGIIFILIGLTLPWLKKSGIGQLPGDFLIKRDNFIIYFPLTTSILISIVIALIFYFIYRH